MAVCPLNVPAAQSVQEAAPFEEYFPAAQSRHTVAPFELYFPASHSMQTPAPCAYLPAMHCPQPAEPTTEVCPLGHGVHSTFPAPVAYVFTGHIVHALAPSLSANQPSGHSTQFGDFMKEYFPFVHVVQTIDPLVEALPAAQSVH